MVEIYQAALWCDDCAEALRRDICDELWERIEKGEHFNLPDGTSSAVAEDIVDLDSHLRGMDERDYDSDEYPKACYGSSESDCPEHCDAGDDCINAIQIEAGWSIGAWLENDLTSDGDDYVREAVREGGPIAELWREWYDYIDFDEDEDEDLCDGCDGSEGCSGECYPHPFTD